MNPTKREKSTDRRVVGNQEDIGDTLFREGVIELSMKSGNNTSLVKRSNYIKVNTPKKEKRTRRLFFETPDQVGPKVGSRTRGLRDIRETRYRRLL